eukprot:3558035-Amphidinium_carterae.2
MQARAKQILARYGYHRLLNNSIFKNQKAPGMFLQKYSVLHTLSLTVSIVLMEAASPLSAHMCISNKLLFSGPPHISCQRARPQRCPTPKRFPDAVEKGNSVNKTISKTITLIKCHSKDRAEHMSAVIRAQSLSL